MASEGGGAGASSDPNLLLEDDFEAGNAEQWLEVAGSPWSVALDSSRSSQSYQLTPVFGDFYASVAKVGSWTDQIIEADVEVLAFGGTSTGDVVALMGRFANIDNYYAAVLRPDGRAAIRARVGGAPSSSLKSSTALGIKVDTWYRLRFELVGTTLRFSIDGQEVAQVDDGNLTHGTVALGGDNSAANFDNVRVTRP
jgi:pectate lyase